MVERLGIRGLAGWEYIVPLGLPENCPMTDAVKAKA